MSQKKYDFVNHPSHYNPGQFEVIKIIRAYDLNFSRGNAIKYLLRAGRKPNQSQIQDLRKAIWYIEDEIKALEGLEAQDRKAQLEGLEGLAARENG